MARKKKRKAEAPVEAPKSAEAQRLAAIGIHVVGADAPDVIAETIRIARRLEKSGRQIIGLWPANDHAAIPPLAVQLGNALVQLTSSTVAFVDANVRYPATLGLADTAKAMDEDESIFGTFWLHQSLALIVPFKVGEAGAGVPQLRYVIASSRELFSFLLVDLTGFEMLGDHLNVCELLDGVVVVGCSGKTKEKDLLRVSHQLEPEQMLGCVMIG